MRLIDVDNVRDLFDAEFKKTRKLILAGETHLDNLAEGFTEANRVIREMPTVDAEVVVRCKDCKNWHTTECALDYAMFEPTDDSFCSYGERKDSGNAEG